MSFINLGITIVVCSFLGWLLVMFGFAQLASRGPVRPKRESELEHGHVCESAPVHHHTHIHLPDAAPARELPAGQRAAAWPEPGYALPYYEQLAQQAQGQRWARAALAKKARGQLPRGS